MLDSLKSTTQAISSAPTLKEAMKILMESICTEINADACSVFLHDETQHDYVLFATTRIKHLLPGQCRIAKGEGLVTLVAERAEPVTLNDATQHERSIELAVLDQEQDYDAFMGVPIIHMGNVLGVVTAQNKTNRTFTENEEAFVVTLSAQLSTIIFHGMQSGRVYEVMSSYGKHKSLRLQGIGAASGVALGEALIMAPQADFSAIYEKASEDIQGDLEKFQHAVECVRKDINAMDESMAERVGPEERTLFTAYLKILDSGSFYKAVIERIEAGQWVQSALKNVVSKNAKAFDAMEDEYLKERATDIRDIGRRILSYLQSQDTKTQHYPFHTILVGKEVTASMLAEIPKKRLRAVVSVKGSSNSHVAILANALGIPAIMGVEALPLDVVAGKFMIVDGYTGRLFIDPHHALQKAYERLASEEQELQANLQELKTLPAETIDGVALSLKANVGLIADIENALEVGADGVGLYRSEVPYMIRDRFPGDDEQRVIYRQFLQSFIPMTVNMRLLDVGGDKALPYFNFEEENPYLGWRGIRILLDHKDLFLQQVRAMLKASESLDNLTIMMPMVSQLSEILEAKKLITQVYQEELSAGLEIKWPKIGVMVEVPSIVHEIDEVLQHVDYVSIGTNDLTQYLLAVDRNNNRVDRLYDGLNPAVIKAIYHVVKRCQAYEKMCSICGELASDPLAVLLLLGMGLTDFSMSATKILSIKWVVRGFSQSDAKNILDEALKLNDPNNIRKLLTKHLVEAGFGGLIRAGKH